MELTDEVEPERGSMVLQDEREHEARKAAHHEAGHLTAAWALNATLYGGDIRSDGRFGGQAVYRLGGDGGASVDRIVTVLAGPAAQRRFAPFEDDGGERDRERVEQHLDVLCRDPGAAAIVARHCRAEASRLIAANWDAVEALAFAFLEREALTGAELAGILADVVEARRRQHWRNVEACACPVSTIDPRITR